MEENKNKKHLILFMPSIEGGGVEKNLFIIANYLINKISNVVIITYDDLYRKSFNSKIKFISYTKKGKPKSKYYKYFICLILLCKFYLKNIKKNIVVFSFQANIYCSILSFFLRFKLIIRSNSSPSGWTNSLIKNSLFMFFFKIPLTIILNSYEFKKELKKKLKLNSTVIYNPLNYEEIKSKSNEKTNLDFFKNKKDFKIINVARFTKQKDHITLLRALKLVSYKINFKLLLIGYGSEKKEILDYIKDNKLKKQVRVINFQLNPYKYIKLADIFILTSRYEGLPNVLLEALTLKKLIISSDCPTGPREILKNGKYGLLFKPSDEKDLSKKIIDVFNKKDLYKKMSLKGHDSLDRFNYEINCKKYYSVINNAFKK